MPGRPRARKELDLGKQYRDIGISAVSASVRYSGLRKPKADWLSRQAPDVQTDPDPSPTGRKRPRPSGRT
jgi:hypothetical protein